MCLIEKNNPVMTIVNATGKIPLRNKMIFIEQNAKNNFRMLRIFLRDWCDDVLENFFTSNNPNKNDNDGDNQKNMDETAKCVGRNETKDPQDNENDCDGIKHSGKVISKE